MSPSDLAQIFLSIPPHEPLAVTLLRERRAATGEMFPRPGENRVKIVRATMEIKRIADETQKITKKLLDLQPVPVSDSRAESIVGGYCL